MNKQNHIIIKGAREHNLKNICLTIPKNKLVLFTGVSGSGKSSMAFDTLFAEGQRRYVESLSSYARQFLGGLSRPQVDLIEGLSPSVAINQKAISHNPRSTVGTVTEIYDYLRLLFARIGHPHCPLCGHELSVQSDKQILDHLLEKIEVDLVSNRTSRFLVMAPMVKNKAGDFRGITKSLRSDGYQYIRIDGQIVDLYQDFAIAKTNKHNLDAIIDRVSIDQKTYYNNKDSITSRLLDDINQALNLGDQFLTVSFIYDSSLIFPTNPINFKDSLYSQKFACPNCNISLPPIEPNLFSFNSPYGACPQCKGLGFEYQIDQSKIPDWKAKILENRYFTTESEFVRQELESYMTKSACPKCHGSRLGDDALSVTIEDKNIYQISQLSINKLKSWIDKLAINLNDSKEGQILKPIKKELSSRLQFLLAVGLDYLSIDRASASLSSGESQRIRLASQIGTGLTGVLYVLDEPTIGLHPRDNQRLVNTLKKLRDLGNSLVVVEHDESLIRQADYIVDFGPLAGKKGGQIISQGRLDQVIKDPNSITGKFLKDKHNLAWPQYKKVDQNTQFLDILGCNQWNLKNINVHLPLNRLVCVTGVSGSGKSTLVHDTIYGAIKKQLEPNYKADVGSYKSISGHKLIHNILLVDQSPIGRTPRSNPATYTKVFDYIRKLMASTTEAQIRGFGPGHFSFNTKGGRCPVCQGQGQIKVDMQFLADVYITCQECHGKRFKQDILEVDYKGKNMADILDMTIEEALDFFKNIRNITSHLKTLEDVGLSYLQLGQASNTLSGGESQRLKISRELVKKSEGNTLYILDEPTTGLHFYDIEKLIKVLRQLVDKGNSVLVIEHNMEVIRNSDWIIDLGPEGGDKGGYIVAQGSIKDIINNPKSYTGKYLSL